MINLSVNVNKVATIRNSRGGNVPDVRQVALDCERFGADGITMHPRPDSRHIRYSDVYDVKPFMRTTLNLEGFPDENFVNLVMKVQPAQVTLVPDEPEALTSDHGWDVEANFKRLSELVALFATKNIRTSLFVDADKDKIHWAAKTGASRIELYTGPYAAQFTTNEYFAVHSFVLGAQYAKDLGMGVNAGHDLNQDNLAWLAAKIPFLDEVSIGHALISDALYDGLEATIGKYQSRLKNPSLFLPRGKY